mmetsp:Transcript_54078/g.171595  ORF Transcript_54078/g.171595 Transcript_54078/m.171595 type:complete len:394 (-) Transcript_54078:112-1293(-)
MVLPHQSPLRELHSLPPRVIHVRQLHRRWQRLRERWRRERLRVRRPAHLALSYPHRGGRRAPVERGRREHPHPSHPDHHPHALHDGRELQGVPGRAQSVQEAAPQPAGCQLRSPARPERPAALLQVRRRVPHRGQLRVHEGVGPRLHPVVVVVRAQNEQQPPRPVPLRGALGALGALVDVQDRQRGDPRPELLGHARGRADYGRGVQPCRGRVAHVQVGRGHRGRVPSPDRRGTPPPGVLRIQRAGCSPDRPDRAPPPPSGPDGGPHSRPHSRSRGCLFRLAASIPDNGGRHFRGPRPAAPPGGRDHRRRSGDPRPLARGWRALLLPTIPGVPRGAQVHNAHDRRQPLRVHRLLRDPPGRRPRDLRLLHGYRALRQPCQVGDHQLGDRVRWHG